MPDVTFRPVRADEVGALISFIAVHNQPGAQHCLQLACNEAGVRADFAKSDIDVAASFVVAEAAGGPWLGAVGVEGGETQCWLHGPWAAAEPASELRRALIGEALQRAGTRRLQAFCDQRSTDVLAELEAAGLTRYRVVHVMQAFVQDWHDRGTDAAVVTVGTVSPGDAAVIARLHDEAFPGTWLAGDQLLDYAARFGRLLVARNAGAAVVGSLCLSFSSELPESDVEFVAVQPAARGAGVGRALLQAALRESFGAATCSIVNLCVNDTNVDALKLYESSGFVRVHTGLALRRS